MATNTTLLKIEQDLYNAMVGQTDQAVLSGALTEARNAAGVAVKGMRDILSEVIQGKYDKTALPSDSGKTLDLGNGYKIRRETYRPNAYYGYDNYVLIGPDGNDVGNYIKQGGQSITAGQNTLLAAYAENEKINPYILRFGVSSFNDAVPALEYFNSNPDKFQPLSQEIERSAGITQISDAELAKIVKDGNAAFTAQTGGFTPSTPEALAAAGTMNATTAKPELQVYDPKTGTLYTGQAAQDFQNGGTAAQAAAAFPGTSQSSDSSTWTTAQGQSTATPAGTASTNKLPPGVLVKNKADNRVYFVDGTGKFRYVPDPSWITGAAVFDVDASHFDQTNMGAPLTEKPTFAFKALPEAKPLMDATGINWTQPRGYNPATDTSNNAPPTVPPAGPTVPPTAPPTDPTAPDAPDAPESTDGTTEMTQNGVTEVLSDTLIAPYNAGERDVKMEEMCMKIIGATLTAALQNGDISQATWDANINNDNQLRNYMYAVLYGGYSIPRAIYGDLKAKELAAQGNSNYANIKTFDNNVASDQWYKTAEGQKVANDSTLFPKANILNIDPLVWDNPIWSVPQQAFSTIIKPIDWESPEFKAEAEKIQAAWHDALLQQVKGTTKAERALAESNYKFFQDTMNQRYGIQLSNNVGAAWNQLNELFGGFSQRELSNTGLAQEAVDKTLGSTRRQDQYLRDAKMSEAQLNERNYLLQSGTPEEIAAFIAANPDKAKLYGMIPDEETKNWFSLEHLKEIYPDMDEEKLQQIHDTMLDENGNYRSALFKKQYSDEYSIGEEKTTYQTGKLQSQKLLEDERAYAPWTSSNPFSSYQAKYITDAYREWASDTGSGTTGSGTTSDVSGKLPGSPTGTLPGEAPVTGSNQAWEAFKTANSKVNWDAYRAIPSGQNNSYYNIQAPAGSNTAYGVPLSSMTKVSDPAYLTKYKADQIYRPTGSQDIYLKPGVTKLW